MKKILLTMLCALLPLLGWAQENEPYAVLSDSNTVLTFYYDSQKAERNGLSVGPFSGGEPSWYAEWYYITTVVFDASFAGCTTLTSTASWFYQCRNLVTISGIENLKTDNVTDMHNMFYGCSGLTSLDVSGFKTDNVTDMNRMFVGCSGLTSLDLSGFKTDNVTNMVAMFSDCSGLTSLDLSGFKTDNVTDMSYMFNECSGLTSIDLSSFNTSKVTSMYEMFTNCSSLTSLDLSNFNTEKVTDMRSMFFGCSSLTSLDVSGFKTDNVPDMGYMFAHCSSLTSLDLSSFNTENVTDMRYMFTNCSSLMSLDLSSFKTDNVGTTWCMFDGCSSLTTIYVGEGWTPVHNGPSMFAGCPYLVGGKGTKYNGDLVDHTYARIDQGPDSDAPGYFTRSGDAPWFEIEAYTVLSENNTVLAFYYDSHKAERKGTNFSGNRSWINERKSITTVVFDASFAGYTNLTSTAHWFSESSNLATISGIENLKTDNVTDMSYMFYECSGLTSLDLSSFNTSNVTNMSYMFQYCRGLTNLNLSGLKNDNVTDMNGMFSGCSSLTSLDLSSFNTSNVTNMNGMFWDCPSLTTLDLNSFNTENVTDMGGMFSYCSGLTTIYVGEGWTIANVTPGSKVFTDCSNLVGGKGTKYNYRHEDYTYARIDQGPDSEAPGYFTRSGDAPWVDPEAYAVLSDNNTVLTFYYDSQKTERNGLSVGPFSGADSQSWSAERESITTVAFDASFAECTTLTSTAYWFCECRNLTTISGIENFKTDNVTDMRYMFSGCSGLTSLDVNGFKTANVTNMSGMFFNCGNLTTIYVGEGWTTANVTSGTDVFTDCSNLVGGKGTKYDAAHTDYTYARIDQGSGSDAPGYFTRSGDAPWVDPEAYAVLSDNNTVLTFYYDGHKVERNGMSVGPFKDSSERGWNDNNKDITSVVFDLSFANDSTLTSTAFWFHGLENLKVITGIGYLNTSNVTDMSEMFFYCGSLISLDLSSINTSNVMNMEQMFYGCGALTNLDLSRFNTENVVDMRGMFNGCSGLTSLDLSSFNTSNVTDMGWMFFDCSSLSNLDLSSLKTSSVMSMCSMFYGCSSLFSLDLSNFNTSNVTNMSSMFVGCGSLTSLDLSGFNTENVTDMGYMFHGCSGLVTIYVGDGWNTSAVTEGGWMFSSCSNLVGGKGTKYDADHTDHTYARIDQGPNSDVPGYFTRSGDTPWVEPEAYTVLSDDKTVLTFYYDGHKAERNGMSVGPFRDSSEREWDNNSKDITSVVFDLSFANDSTLTSTTLWFHGFENLKVITGIENLNTSNVTDMNSMFFGCSSLTSLDLSSFNTEKVTNIYGMFNGCSGLTTIYAGEGWITANVTEGTEMFTNCSNLVGGKGTAYSADHTDCTYACIDQGPNSDASGYFTRSGDAPWVEPEAYTVLSDSNTVLTFYYDSHKAERKGTNISDYRYSRPITTVVFDASFAGCTTLTSTAHWFDGCSNLVTISGIENLKTNSVTNMEYMFHDCSGLTSLDVSGFNTENVTNMEYMFHDCSGLTSLDVSGFNTENVTNMCGMFSYCSGLTSLDVSGFKMDKVTDMRDMFSLCSGLTSLDLSCSKPDSVTDMSCMFYNCQGLTSLNLRGFKPDNMRSMFYNCHSLTSLDVSGFNTDNVTDMNCMFEDCSGLTSLDLSGFKTDNVTDMGGMFSGCSGLTSLDVSGFNTENVTDMRNMFGGCRGLTSLDVSGFKTDNVTDMCGMFSGCSSLTSLDLSGFNTENVTDMECMFEYCYALTSLNLSSFRTDNVTNMKYMFRGCSSLTNLDVSSFKTDNVTDMGFMFYVCSSLASLDLSSFKTDNVKGISNMFYGCNVLTTIYVGEGWTTANVFANEGFSVFANCSNLIGGKGTKYDGEHTDYTYARIDQGPDSDVPGYFTRSGDAPWVEPEPTEAYAVLSDSNTVLTFYYDNQKAERNGMSVVPFEGASEREWNDNCKDITSVVFDSSFASDSTLTSTAFWFWGCSNLTTISGIENLNTSNVTDMKYMFVNCSSLTSLDLSTLNTKNVTNISQLFPGCSSLTSLDLSGFNTSNVTDMSYMFHDCSSLVTIYVGDGWNTSAVTEGGWMFSSCSNLVGGKGTKYDGEHADYTYARIDQGPDSDVPGYFTRSGDAPWVEPEPTEAYAVLSDNNTVLTFYYDNQKAERNGMSVGPFYHSDYLPWSTERESIATVVFDTSFAGCTTLTSTAYWFYQCSNLDTISGMENLNTSNVTDMVDMFSGCSSLTILDLSSFNTEKVTDMGGMFASCTGLTNLDLSGFNTSNVTNMVQMFVSCTGLTDLDLSGFNTANVTDMRDMFKYCSSLTSLDLSGFNTKDVTDMSGMFERCSLLTSLDLNNFNTSNVTSMMRMFWGCSSLTSLNINSFDTFNVTDMRDMFEHCSSLTSLDLSSFNTENVMGMRSLFEHCSSLTSLDLSNFRTSNVTVMNGMFRNCDSLTTIYVGEGWNMSAITGDVVMFENCLSLVGGKGTKYDADHQDYTYARIDQGPDSEAPGYFTRSGDAPWVEPEPTEAYAVLSDSNTMLTFYYDNQKAERNGMSVVPFEGALQREWNDNCKDITSVVFDSSFASDSTLTSTAYWFCRFENLKVITGIENLNMSNVTDMSSMFAGCSSLASLDLSGFNTANVTYMSAMFANCSSLTSLDLSSFNTSNVTDVVEMFDGCSSLTSLDLSSFNTGNITDMYYMFVGCSSLTSLDLSSFNTKNVTKMARMFSGCNSLISLDLSSFNTSNVTDMHAMFWGCDSLATIYVGEGWNTGIISGDEMFTGCSSLVGGKGTKYDSDHTDHIYARIDQGPDSDAPGYFTRSGDIPWGERATFDGRVLTVRGSGSIDAALAQVGGFEQVDKTITAIVWEADVPYSGEAAFSNPNLLFYANDATKGQAINNLIYNGVAESITLTDEGEGNTDFYCPQSFTARSITYKRSFQQQTEIGVSRGWETIALPFTVQRISRVRSGGEGRDNITPFGSSEGDRHFWLRRLTANGLQSVQAIEANTPYIIAMPNSEEYAAEYNLAGDIVFTAENATVAVTEPVSDRSADYELTANFERMTAQDSIYVLNVGAPRYGYPEGSLFEAAYRDLQPFRAYTRHINSGRPAPPYFALGNLGGDNTTGISPVSDDTFATDTWYDIQGRKLQGRPTQKGVYIHNGRKVIVK